MLWKSGRCGRSEEREDSWRNNGPEADAEKKGLGRILLE